MSRRQADRVYWGEGLLVCQQHLQQQDLFYEAYVSARSDWPNPYSWGLTDIEIDSAALKTGEFALKSFRGILPAGLPVDLAEGDPSLPMARPIDENFPNTAAVLEVYLGVPAVREGAENFIRREAVSSTVAPHRFEVWSRDVLDLVDAGSEVNVSFARPRAIVLFGEEERDDYETIKIAELKRDGSGGFETSADFIPTSLRMSASRLLRERTTELVGLMVAKRRAIVDALRQVDASRVEFSAQDVTRSLQLGALSSHLPMVQHISKAPDTPVFWLYSTLSALAGQLTSFSTKIAPEDLPGYHHVDLRSTFVELFAKLRALLELTMQENFIDVPLEARRDGMWIGMLKDPKLLECSTYVLAVESDTPQQDTANRIPQLSKIASWQQIPRIVRSATPGAPLTASHRPPPQIPIRPHVVYFLIDTTHSYWKQIVTEKTIAVFLPPPFDPERAKIRLFAVPSAERLSDQ